MFWFALSANWGAHKFPCGGELETKADGKSEEKKRTHPMPQRHSPDQ